jgi:hypothetical protein
VVAAARFLTILGALTFALFREIVRRVVRPQQGDDRPDTGEHAPHGPTIEAEEVMEHFRRETGDTLNCESAFLGLRPGEGRVDRLGFDGPTVERNGELSHMPAPPTVRAKYGNFVIWVFEDPHDAWGSQHGEPDSRGRYWMHNVPERGPYAGQSQWAALKLYGSNVRLSWFTEDGERRADSRWDVLDRILSELESRKQGAY